jgi:hypothetical protein
MRWTPFHNNQNVCSTTADALKASRLGRRHSTTPCVRAATRPRDSAAWAGRLKHLGECRLCCDKMVTGFLDGIKLWYQITTQMGMNIPIWVNENPKCKLRSSKLVC